MSFSKPTDLELEMDAIRFAEILETCGVNFSTLYRYEPETVLYEFTLIDITEANLISLIKKAFCQKLIDLAGEQYIIIKVNSLDNANISIPGYLKGKYRQAAVRDLYEFELEVKITPPYKNERILQVVLISAHKSELTINEFKQKYKPTFKRRLKQLFAWL